MIYPFYNYNSKNMAQESLLVSFAFIANNILIDTLLHDSLQTYLLLHGYGIWSLKLISAAFIAGVILLCNKLLLSKHSAQFNIWILFFFIMNAISIAFKPLPSFAIALFIITRAFFSKIFKLSRPAHIKIEKKEWLVFPLCMALIALFVALPHFVGDTYISLVSGSNVNQQVLMYIKTFVLIFEFCIAIYIGNYITKTMTFFGSLLILFTAIFSGEETLRIINKITKEPATIFQIQILFYSALILTIAWCLYQNKKLKPKE